MKAVRRWRWYMEERERDEKQIHYRSLIRISVTAGVVYTAYTQILYIYSEAGARKSRAVNLAPKRRRPLICFSRSRRPGFEGWGKTCL
jgi:hypothetical protein